VVGERWLYNRMYRRPVSVCSEDIVAGMTRNLFISQLLRQGRVAMADQTQAHDTMHEDVWRIFKIMSEFIEGFETLSRFGKCVTIFGSAELP